MKCAGSPGVRHGTRRRTRAEALATIVETKPRKGSKGPGWTDDGAPEDPEMRAVILRLMRGRHGD